MQQSLTTLKDWWPFVALGIFVLCWEIFEIAGKIRARLRIRRARREPIKLQYTALFVRVTTLLPTRDLSVELIVKLDNPTEFPIKTSQVRMLTMMLYLNSDEIPADHQSLVLAPRTRRVTIQSRPIHVPFKKGRDRLTGYVEWQIKYGRADVEPFEFTHLFNLRGDVEAHLVNGGWETRWAPFDDSEVIVADEHTELMLDEKGQFSRKR